MSAERNIRAEIERGEAWLRGGRPADPPAPLDRIKLRVRIEVDQAWLRLNAPADPPCAGLPSVKRAMSTELERLAGVGPARKHRILRRVVLAAGPVAAAAVVALAFLLHQAPPTQRGGGAIAVRLDDWVNAVSMDATVSSGEVEDWASLKDAFVSLEDGLAEDFPSEWDGQSLDEIGDDLEVLLSELG